MAGERWKLNLVNLFRLLVGWRYPVAKVIGSSP